MLGQLRVEPELELEPFDPALELELEPEEPLLVLPDPVLGVLELDEDGVVVEEPELVEPEVEEPEVELEPVPVLPELEVVAALATNAPPTMRPEVSAPIARTFRRRMCMSYYPFHFVCCPGPSGPVPHTMRPSPVAPRRASAMWWWSSLTIR
jgi:hypothetical protein